MDAQSVVVVAEASRPARRVVGVDLGGTRVRAVLADSEGRFLARTSRSTEAALGLEEVLNNIQRAIEKVCRDGGINHVNPDTIAAIGIGAPGPLNPYTGVVYSPPNLPGWNNVPLKAILEARLNQVPVFLGNDANLAGLGEYRFGAAKGRHNVIYMTVSTGIGGGIIIDDKMLEGVDGAAGEIGHTTMEINGPLCGCGNHGCLEILAAGPALRRIAIERIQAGEESVLRQMAEARGGLEHLQPEMVEQAARAKDPLALDIMQTAGRYLGVGIANLLHIFNPEIVVIGGGVSRAGELIFNPIHQEVEKRAMPAFRARVSIVPSPLGDDVGLYGAVALALAQATESTAHP